MMKKRDLSLLLSSVVLLALIFYFISAKKGFWWYILAIFIISPVAGMIGWSLGKEDPEDKKVADVLLGQAKIEADRERKCKDKGGFYQQGSCKKLGVNGLETIDLTK